MNPYTVKYYEMNCKSKNQSIDMMYIKGLINPNYKLCLDFFEREKAINYESKEMQKVDEHYEEYSKLESSLSYKYEFYKKIHQPKENKGSLYLIYNRYTNLTKIGVSKNVEKRLRSLELNNGVELELVHTKKTLTPYFLESFLHNVYFKKRKLGEWFDLSYNDYLDIEELTNKINA